MVDSAADDAGAVGVGDREMCFRGRDWRVPLPLMVLEVLTPVMDTSASPGSRSAKLGIGDDREVVAPEVPPRTRERNPKIVEAPYGMIKVSRLVSPESRRYVRI